MKTGEKPEEEADLGAICPKEEEGLRPERLVGADRRGDRGIEAAELLHDARVPAVREAETPVRLRHEHPEEAELFEAAENLGRDLPFAIDLGGVDVLVEEPPHVLEHRTKEPNFCLGASRVGEDHPLGDHTEEEALHEGLVHEPSDTPERALYVAPIDPCCYG